MKYKVVFILKIVNLYHQLEEKKDFIGVFLTVCTGQEVLIWDLMFALKFYCLSTFRIFKFNLLFFFFTYHLLR